MFPFVTNQSVDNQAPDKTSSSVKVIFVWKIDLNLYVELNSFH